MKKTLLAITTLGLSLPSSNAGQPATLQPAAPSTPLYRAGEIQLDLFGVYGVGNAPVHAGPFREHAWGGGLGLNYFWTQNLGIGIDADMKHGVENALIGEAHKTIEQYTASLIYRYPLENSALAPYAYGGGGVTAAGQNLGSAHAGVGLEYRFAESQIGVFVDSRWTYYGDRFGKGDLNNFQFRSGVRFPF
jgi:hypothetical protein